MCNFHQASDPKLNEVPGYFRILYIELYFRDCKIAVFFYGCYQAAIPYRKKSKKQAGYALTLCPSRYSEIPYYFVTIHSGVSTRLRIGFFA